MSMLSRLLHRDDRDPTGSGDGILIEPMRRRHLTAIQRIEQQVYPRPWPVGVFASELDLVRRDERYYIVATTPGGRQADVLGYGGLMFVIDDAHVTNIAVDPELHRAGVGTRLLAEMAWEAIGRGCVALTLEVRASNAAAQALYRQFGFVPAGVRQRYYENTDDAIVMWCNDIETEAYQAELADLCPHAVPSVWRRLPR
jgi:ribosomal-protein-alanine N-acetyltransferase